MQKIKGTIKNIVFRNMDGWAVFNVMVKGAAATPCTGVLPSMVDINHVVICEGEYVKSKYGMQLKCDSIAPAPPDTKTDEGVIRLLTLLPGIGQSKAKSAVQELGADMAWLAAREHPSYLGISDYDKALKAKETAQGLISSYSATTFFLGIGLTENQANKIIAKYGADKAVVQVQTEPYALINDINGFGFRIVDGIALKAGLKSDSEQRALACILFCLDDNEKNQGNIWFYGKHLVKVVLTELEESAMSQGVPAKNLDYGKVRDLIYRLGSEGLVVINDGKVYSKELLMAERRIAKCLLKINTKKTQ
jgi:exodeoxyribonuclease V alpha subunit